MVDEINIELLVRTMRSCVKYCRDCESCELSRTDGQLCHCAANLLMLIAADELERVEAERQKLRMVGGDVK